MANTVTLASLAPELYQAADIIGRERVGVLTSCILNTQDNNGVNRAAKGDIVKSMATSEVSIDTSFTPAMTISDATDATETYKSFALTETAKADLPLTGETIRRLNNTTGGGEYRLAKITQMMRGVTNKIESFACVTGYKGASRAVGTAGVTPFASNFNVLNEARQVLTDNGCPDDGMWSAVFNTSAGTNMRNLTGLQRVNESGDSNLLRRGALGDISGFMLKESAQIASHTKGTGASYLIDGVDAIGATTIAVDGGTGTILAGDIVTLAAQDGDTGEENHKYVVNSPLADGSFAIGTPGLRFASVDNEAVTVGANYTANLCFHRNAIEIAVRAADMGDDAAVEVLPVTDPISGITYEFRRYAGEGMSKIMVVVYYGGVAWKSDFIATLLG